MGFDFEIVYRLRCENKAANALSRNRKFMEELQAYLMTQMVGDKGLQKENDENEKLQKIKQELQCNPITHQGYSIKGKVLLYKGILVILKGSRFIPSLLTEFHSTSYGGHSGFMKLTKELLPTYIGKE